MILTRRFTNTAYYSGNIKYTNLTEQRLQFWQVPLQSLLLASFLPLSNLNVYASIGLTVNGHSIDAGNAVAILETGTAWSQ